MDRVKDLGRNARETAARVEGLAVPEEARRATARVAGTADRLDAPEPDARRRAIADALGRLSPLADPDWALGALAAPLSVLPGVGPRRAETLARRGLGRVADLLYHLPTRYDDRRELLPVAELEVGRRVTFVARVLGVGEVPGRDRRGRRRKRLEAVVGDDTGTIQLKWFHGADVLKDIVTQGALLLVTGEVRRYRFSKELLHPEVDLLREDAVPEDSELPRVVADYPVVEGVPPRTLRRLVGLAVERYADLVVGLFPAAQLPAATRASAAEALKQVHAPSADADVEALRKRSSPDHRRLVLEELYLLEVGLALRRDRRRAEDGIPVAGDGPRSRGAPSALPFRLTGAQERVWSEIRADLARPHPMNRLLLGDVGSGKTAVALLAAVAVAEAGGQTALMAPTELLAEQHMRTLERLAGPMGLRIELLTASRPRPALDAAREALASGAVDLVVGTHALVQRDVRFAALTLAVVDEQHRFGVLQRAALAAKTRGARSPHVLVMTATPIPRTLALTLYGELDLSVIDALPPGRAPVVTDVLREGEGRRVVELIRAATGRGEQVYVVYPLVEESEKLDLRAATDSAERVARAFPDLAVDLVHGRLDPAARAAAMGRFEAGETHILVSTSVVEVGVDVPNATLMVVEHAERFGLAQLHQLRGRVGRGDRPGTCLLVARGGGEQSEARLRAMLETTDGFAIADADLRIRGPGEFLGTRQSGLPDLRIADLTRDAALVVAAREAALATVAGDPHLRSHGELARAVRARWGEKLALADVG